MGQAQAKAAVGFWHSFSVGLDSALTCILICATLLTVKSAKPQLLSAHSAEKVLGACLVLRDLKMEFAVETK